MPALAFFHRGARIDLDIYEVYVLYFSAQDILDGVDALLAPLVDLANALINELLSALPSFDLPGKSSSPLFDLLFCIEAMQHANPENFRIN